MKILVLAPLTRKIDSNITAGRPRVIFDLLSGLVKRGHKITVLGTKNSKISGVKFIPVINKGFYEIAGEFENEFYGHTGFLTKQALMAEKLSSNFDVIHNHSYPEFVPFLVSKRLKAPMVTTLHMAMSKKLDEVFSEFSNTNLICASESAKKMAHKTKMFKVIHHGVDLNLYKFESQKDDYLLWIGRLSKAKDSSGNFMDPKGVKTAIELAQKTNQRLMLVANVEDNIFFEKEVKPYLSDKIQWVGDIGSEQPLSKKEISKLMQKAKALLMTTKLPEAFGLVMAEAQSCGTPVIGFDIGPVSEIIINKKTGFVVKIKDGVKGMIKVLKKIEDIKPADCRKNAEENFSIERMVSDYEAIYKILKR
jgi:hypothetical protein